ncbi:MAG: hypothetical protein GTN69_13350 [Armatimonadetes bacterium]|nr:hypothetical protein [Armatimonadota bacterium]
MANYPIWISTDKAGTPMVGAHMMDDSTVSSEQIFPSQMAHRCTARTKTGRVTICTPTNAGVMGWEILAYFPRADGSLGRNA